jgi:hypothetical protein
MKASAIVFILAVLVALGLSGYNTWAVMSLKNDAKEASEKADVSINVAQNSRLQLGNVLDLEEFLNLDPDLKALYKEVYVAKVFPAAIKIVNEVWAEVPADKKEEIRRMARKVGDEAVSELEREKNRAIRQMRQMGGRPPRPLATAVVRATMKPVKRVMP